MPRRRNGQATQVPTGLPFGQRGALEAAQDAAPLPTGAPIQQVAPAGPGGAPGGGGPPVSLPDVFGATGRPAEPLTAGAAAGAGPMEMGLLPDDPAMLLRAIATQYPAPGIRRLLERMGQ